MLGMKQADGNSGCDEEQAGELSWHRTGNFPGRDEERTGEQRSHRAGDNSHSNEEQAGKSSWHRTEANQAEVKQETTH